MILIGWLGATLLALCGVPEVIKTYQENVCNLSWGFMLMWLFGELLTIIYVIFKLKNKAIWPLIFNYGINIICILLLIFFKVGLV